MRRGSIDQVSDSVPDDVLKAYLNIFKLDADKIKVEGVKAMGVAAKSIAREKVYDLSVIVSAPSEIENLQVDASEITSLRNKTVRSIHGETSFTHTSEWYKIFDKNGVKMKKKKRFEIIGSLSPIAVLDWEVKDGKYYILIKAFGMFS